MAKGPGTSEARRVLRELRRDLRLANATAVKAMRKQGRAEQKLLASLYQSGKVYADDGTAVRIIAPGARWRAMKRRHRLPFQTRGMATGGIERSIRSAKAFIPLPSGFAIKPAIAGVIARYPAKLGGPRPVAQYLPWHNVRKAFGQIGKLGTRPQARIFKEVRRAIDAQLKGALGKAMTVRGGVKVVKLEMQRFGLKV